MFRISLKVHFKQLQDKTSEYARKTRRSVDLEKIRSKRDKFKNKFKNVFNIEEDDIPNWMRRLNGLNQHM